MTFLSLLKPHKKQVVLNLLLIFSSNILALALPWCIKIIIDDVITNNDSTLLNFTAAALILIVGIRSLLNYLHRYQARMLGERVLCQAREKIYKHIQRLPLNSIKQISPSELLTRMTGDVDSVKKFICNDILMGAYAFINVIFVLGILFFLNIKLTLLSTAFLPLFIATYIRYLPNLKDNHKSLRDGWAKLIVRVNEVLQGIGTVRACTGEKFEQKLFRNNQKSILQFANKAHTLNAGLWVAIEFSSYLAIVLTLWFGANSVIQQAMTPGAFVAFYAYLIMLFSPIIQLVAINSGYQEASAGLRRMNDILSIAPIDQKGPLVKIAFLKGAVEFRNVCFAYAKGENVLNNVSFSIFPGETIGIVGRSGSGKTTLISLLLGLLDPQQGEILIDGIPLKQIDHQSLRQQIAVVLQDDTLFSGSIHENICYGSSQEVTFHQIVKSAEAAQAHSFIKEFDDGYDTQIGERGVRLSCGQKQRIALSRALVREPRILVLDEATSSLDALTENAVQESIKKEMSGKTTILVAHRFSTVMHADKIIVLDKGEIVETGDHQRLLQTRGFYSRFYYEQFKEDNVESITPTPV